MSGAGEGAGAGGRGPIVALPSVTRKLLHSGLVRLKMQVWVGPRNSQICAEVVKAKENPKDCWQGKVCTVLLKIHI